MVSDMGDSEVSQDQERAPRVVVLAPAPLLVVEIAQEAGGADRDGNGEPDPEIHLHPGGQGVWVAGMAVTLGADVTLCAPLAGELGEAVEHMLSAAGITVRSVGTGNGTGAAVVDLRGEEREEIAVMPPPALGRHDIDDYYGQVLVEALDAHALVVTGVNPPELLAPDFFSRLVADARAADVPVVADLSGDAALAVIAEGPSVLKMSHEELIEVGLASGDDVAALLAAAREAVAQGVGAMVVSRAEEPALLVTAAGAWFVSGPAVRPVVVNGAGDSMTAGIAAALARGSGIADALRLGAAAGALNVTRRGLGSGKREQIERLAEQIEISPVDPALGGAA
jgi:1-phosphofructokinase